MTQLTRKQVEELRQIATRLLGFVDSIDDTPIVVDAAISELVEKRVAERICLACGQKALPDEQMRRGQDPGCYSTTRSRIRRGLTTERQLIEQGKLTAERATGGRVAKQDLLNTDGKTAELQHAAEAIEQYKSNQAKKRGKGK